MGKDRDDADADTANTRGGDEKRVLRNDEFGRSDGKAQRWKGDTAIQ